MHPSSTRVLRVSAFLLWCSSWIPSPLRGGELPQPTIVPWQVLTPGRAYRQTPLIVIWIPASADEFRHSELLSFRPLLEYDSQCVSLRVIRSDDVERIEKLGASGKLPTVILTSSDGTVFSRVEPEKGVLSGPAVEKALHDELRARQESAGHDLDDAPKKLAIGDRDGAIGLYRRVCEQRCFLPRHAREAERALRKLGVPLVAASQ